MIVAGYFPAAESQTSHISHLNGNNSGHWRRDIGTKSYKNITHLAAELHWTTFTFKYSLLSLKKQELIQKYEL